MPVNTALLIACLNASTAHPTCYALAVRLDNELYRATGLTSDAFTGGMGDTADYFEFKSG